MQLRTNAGRHQNMLETPCVMLGKRVKQWKEDPCLTRPGRELNVCIFPPPRVHASSFLCSNEQKNMSKYTTPSSIMLSGEKHHTSTYPSSPKPSKRAKMTTSVLATNDDALTPPDTVTATGLLTPGSSFVVEIPVYQHHQRPQSRRQLANLSPVCIVSYDPCITSSFGGEHNEAIGH